jgi:hypothetical protein
VALSGRPANRDAPGPSPSAGTHGRRDRAKPGAADLPSLRFLRLTCPITLDTERYLADDTRGGVPAGVLNAGRAERSGWVPDAMRGGNAVMTTSVVIGQLTAIAVVILGGDPLPRAGPGGLPHTNPRP